MTHAWERSIVRAVGVTKTVSHPYKVHTGINILPKQGSSSYDIRENNVENANLVPALHQDIQSLQWFDCEEIECDLPRWLY